MSYTSPSSYQNRVFSTRNTEYHVVGGVCVAVRDKRTGRWNVSHAAVGSALEGGLCWTDDGGFEAHRGAPVIGDKLCFSGSVLTSSLVSVSRPSMTAVTKYQELTC